MRILVIGSGGREHALVRALRTEDVHAAPGNPGIAAVAPTYPEVTATPEQILGLARKLSPDLVVVGPEAPLVAGAADALREAGIACFGPDAAAARIEGSKSFAKQVMAEARIPTAASFTGKTPGEADEALAAFGPPYVVKDDALAAGKGVLVTNDLEAARAHARACGTVVIEEFLDGPEVSLFAVCDGTTAVPLLPAQDFKRAGDGDQGPNTGGMGAYAPLPWAPADLAEQTMATVIKPALDTMRRRGTPYRGLLYAGLALTPAGIRVVEFNARFGDPETQVVLDRLDLGTSPLAPLLAAAAAGDLTSVPPLAWHPGAAVTVVIAAEGYPADPAKGDTIKIVDNERGGHSYLLHAGTATGADGILRSSGGRVLNAVGSGPDIAAARAAAYELAATVELRGGWYRHDIAARRA
ncbi:MAG TPA: phosphoribosylamine--glycine ligase [Streptosporangiaceae bacterium]|nr:phosphoribosylamine--glycine ligase [Streptosporangiaceae bacterium]